MFDKKVKATTVRQNPRDAKFVQDPYTAYAAWHKDARAIYWEEYDFWCLYRYDDVATVLRDRRFARLPPACVDQPPVAPHLRDFAAAEQFSLLALEPPQHTRLRSFVNRAFLSRQVLKLEPLVAEIANRCIDAFNAKGTVDILQHFATPIPLQIITRLLGVPDSASDQLLAWSHAMVRVYTLSQTFDEEIIANEAAAHFREFLLDVLQKKRKQAGQDLLSQLLALNDKEQVISDEEIVCVSILLLNAGHEATVHQLGNAIYTLLKQYAGDKREQLCSLLADDDTADSVVAECLRYAAPLHLFTRFAQQHITLADEVTLAPGEKIGLLLAAANRCPLKFNQPNRFIPERSDAAHLSLGAGIHYCVGAQLAKVELRTALQVLFKRLPQLELVSEPDYQDTYHFHGLQQLLVRW